MNKEQEGNKGAKPNPATEKNWYGETLTEEERSELVKRIMALPENMIDELWFRIGYILASHGSNKAISPEDVKKIKKSEKEAWRSFEPVFEEAHIYRIKTFLDEVEIECGIRKHGE
jgi:hypothetical protein